MINKTKIYNLLLNHQSEFLMTLKALGIKDPEVRIKNLLDEQLFEVIECNENDIFAIKKKSTGEVFKKGCRVYHRKYDIWLEDIYFLPNELFGIHYGGNFYQNYVRATSGLYHLNEISLTKKEPKEIPCDDTLDEEIVLNGKTYVLKK